MTKQCQSALSAIIRFHAKPENAVGGNLHVILDDPNFDDDSVQFCLEQAHAAGDADGEAVALMLASLSETEREMVYEAYWNLS